MKILRIGDVWLNVAKISAIWTEEKKIFVQVDALKVNTGEYADDEALSRDLGSMLQAFQDVLGATQPTPACAEGCYKKVESTPAIT